MIRSLACTQCVANKGPIVSVRGLVKQLDFKSYRSQLRYAVFRSPLSHLEEPRLSVARKTATEGH